MGSGNIVLYTAAGNAVRRFRGGVGKSIGGRIYVHRDYAKEVVPVDLMKRAVRCLPKGFKYNAVVYDINKCVVRFDEARNFDYAREPWPGNFIKVSSNGEVSKGFSPSIWHHKWMWVKDDYKGFDVAESYRWSEMWLGRLEKQASGSMNVWMRQLMEVGLK